MIITMVKGDYVFNSFEGGASLKAYNKQILELRKQGYRKVGQEYALSGDYSEFYRKKGKKNVITVTII